MNKSVFFDTSAIAAIINKNDNNHKESLRILKKIEQKYFNIISNFVIAETHALLLSRLNDIKIATEWLNNAYNDFNVIRPEENIEKEAIKCIIKFKDKDYSFTDMLSFLIMEKLNVKYYFAFDKHFKQIGKFENIKKIL